MADHSYTTSTSSFLEALRNLQAKGKLQYQTFSDGWVVRFWRDDRVHHIIGHAFDANAQAAAELAKDKVAAYLLMKQAGIPAVEHTLLTTPVMQTPDQTTLRELFARHGQLVIKPTHGGHGLHVVKCEDVKSALRLIASVAEDSWSASPFLDLVSELRLVVFNDGIKLAYRKSNPQMAHGLKMFNPSLGATPELVDITLLDPLACRLATDAMRSIGLSMGAVDIVTDTQGTVRVLEINAGFSIEHFAAYTPDNRQAAVKFYETVIETLLARPKTSYSTNLETASNYMVV